MDIKLVGFKPNGTRFEIPLAGDTTVLGRGEDCNVQVPISSISRRHCELSIEGDYVRIRDLGSANGTFVNNNRISEVRVSAGDRVVLGSLVLILQIDGEPADIEPAQVMEQAPAVPPESPAEEIALSGDEELAPVPLDGEGPISLDEEPVAAGLDEDPFADLADDDTGDAASSADVLGKGDSEDEVDPISALEMLAAEDQTPEDEEEQT